MVFLTAYCILAYLHTEVSVWPLSIQGELEVICCREIDQTFHIDFVNACWFAELQCAISAVYNVPLDENRSLKALQYLL